jgi:two-component system, NarL family, response regulator NreC
MIGVFLIDDHAVVREGLCMLIEAQPDMRVVGEADRGRGVVDVISRTENPADVVVLDVSMPDASGPAVAADIRRQFPGTKILALTRHAEKAYVQQMLQAGATGYVLKQTVAGILITAIRAVVEGGTYLDPAVAGKLTSSFTHGRSTGRIGGAVLTPREQEILVMVAYGHTNKEIANTLGITGKTVETHKANLMEKLELNSRAALVRFALTQGWLEK